MLHIKKLTNDKLIWDGFCAVLDIKIANEHRKMEQVTDVEDLYRCQGAIAALRKLKNIRDEYNG